MTLSNKWAQHNGVEVYMNILVGQKTPGSYNAGIQGLDLLNIPNPYITIVSGCDPGPEGSTEIGAASGLPLAELAASSFGVVSKSVVSQANWVEAVLMNAQISRPDLIIISDDTFELSSDCRPKPDEILQIVEQATCSVLISRTRSSNSEAPLALFATDHSPFCLRSIRSLLRLLPTGITHIRVVSALENSNGCESGSSTKITVKARPRLSERTLVELNRALVEHLESYGFSSDAQIYLGLPEEAIESLTKKLNPDFLILCSQGAGFSPNKTLGNIVRHQVQTTRESILILRP